MAPPGASSERLNLDLLHASTKPGSALQLAIVCHEEAPGADRSQRNFLRHLQAAIFNIHPLLGAFRNRGNFSPFPPSLNLLLYLLDSLVVGTVHDRGEHEAARFTRLRALQERPDQDAQAEPKCNLLDLGNFALQKFLLDNFDSCSKELLEYMNIAEVDVSETIHTKRRGPNYDVRSLNHELFESLWSTIRHCTHCNTPISRLSLVTHRKSSPSLESDVIISTSDFERGGQELKLRLGTVQSGKKPKITWEDSQPATKKPRPIMRKLKIGHICDPFQKAREASLCLHLLAEDRILYLENKSQARYTPKDVECPVTLRTLSSRYGAAFTDQTKLIIAVILGHSLLHFLGTHWTRNWSLDSIVFIRCGDIIPLKPYLTSAYVPEQEDENEEDLFFRVHQHPDILALGIMLLELDLKESIYSYVSTEPSAKPNFDFATADKAFKKRKSHIYKNYRRAIDTCLDVTFGEDLDGAENMEEFRHQIYQKIVKPLEDELESGFSDMLDIDNLDAEVWKMDVAEHQKGLLHDIEALSETKDPVKVNAAYSSHSTSGYSVREVHSRYNYHMAQPSVGIPRHQLFALMPATAIEKMREIWPLPATSMESYRTQPSVEDGVSAGLNVQASDASAVHACRSKSPFRRSQSSPRNNPEQLQRHRSESFQLFDEWDPKDSSETSAQHTDEWFNRLKKFTLSILEAKEPKIKIAILDTGIDLGHQDMIACEERIKDVRSWVNGADGVPARGSEDKHGHGTHVAGIVLEVAEEADVYIAKVANDSTLGDPESVAKALQYATTTWQVDIITMSFGYPNRIQSIESAIRDSKCLIFAAAANHGGNFKRAHPARQEGVICIHSTDGYGCSSRFNPSPVEGDENFSIVGENICSARAGGGLQRKTGTSFATPVAAGLAAVVLEWAKQNLKDEKEILQRLRTCEGMKNVFKLMGEKRGGYRYLAPWELFSDAKSAKGLIQNALKEL